jgi:hypothetical protein
LNLKPGTAAWRCCKVEDMDFSLALIVRPEPLPNRVSVADAALGRPPLTQNRCYLPYYSAKSCSTSTLSVGR